jgi:predicted nucleic acid-binding protein
VKAFVVDASVAARWMVPEEVTTQALALPHGTATTHAPARWLGAAAKWAMFAVRRELSREAMIARIRWVARVKGRR